MNTEEFSYLQKQLTDLQNRITRIEVRSQLCPCLQADISTGENDVPVNSQQAHRLSMSIIDRT